MENKQGREKKNRKQAKVALRDLKPSNDVKGGYWRIGQSRKIQ